MEPSQKMLGYSVHSLPEYVREVTMWKTCKSFCFCCKASTSTGPSSLSSAEYSLTDKEHKLKDFVVKKGNILSSSHSHYLVKEFAGEGRFGKVVKCVKLKTSQEVAVKILKTKKNTIDNNEIHILKKVSTLDPVKKNVVQFFDHFNHRGHTCLAFELLDKSLIQLLRESMMEPLSLSEIRPITQQLVTALDALKGIGIIHSDLKPDNIMLVNHVDQPFRIKVIDFGLAFSASVSHSGVTVQPLGYRAPEVSLGLHISEAIDMWSLGCVLVLLCLGRHPFSIVGEYEMIRDIVFTLGQPSDHLLDAGDFTQKFFKKNKLWHKPKWWLKTPREYHLHTSMVFPERYERSFESLNSLITAYPEMQESIELEDERAFASLLECILETDPEKRITPEEALKHPFISMAHMEAQRGTSAYVYESLDFMSVIPDDEEELPPTDDADLAD